MNTLRLLALLTCLAFPLFLVDISSVKKTHEVSLAGRWQVESATINGEPDPFRRFDELVFTDHQVEYRSTKPRPAPIINVS
jgi:hypothetical protein